MKSFIIASGAALLCAVSGAAVGTPVLVPRATPSVWAVQRPSERPVANDPRVQGCFSSAGDLTFVQTVEYNSRDSCPKAICNTKLGKDVGGTIRGNECWCGDKYPPKSSLVDDKDCNAACTGYGQEACGGDKVWTIYNTGKQAYGVDYMPDETKNNTQTDAPKPVVSSAAPSSTPSAPPQSSGSNTAGIAAGVVVGVVALAAIAGGAWFFYRKRRNQALEEEHRRNAAVNAFIHGNKPPSSSGGVSLTDSRMDPQMAQRRMSDGSIVDNQDYSRRILRVTNA
uniref:WSC domain-containing protein n=1 Tax=Pyricularia oryzae (strain P131) TaxID=1143193 RepID=L7J2R0_PYRO1